MCWSAPLHCAGADRTSEHLGLFRKLLIVSIEFGLAPVSSARADVHLARPSRGRVLVFGIAAGLCGLLSLGCKLIADRVTFAADLCTGWGAEHSGKRKECKRD